MSSPQNILLSANYNRGNLLVSLTCKMMLFQKDFLNLEITSDILFEHLILKFLLLSLHSLESAVTYTNFRFCYQAPAYKFPHTGDGPASCLGFFA